MMVLIREEYRVGVGSQRLMETLRWMKSSMRWMQGVLSLLQTELAGREQVESCHALLEKVVGQVEADHSSQAYEMMLEILAVGNTCNAVEGVAKGRQHTESCGLDGSDRDTSAVGEEDLEG